MRITLLLTALMLAASPAMSQESTSETAPVAQADAPLVLPSANGSPQPAANAPGADDPVGRIENRLDRIERRLDEQSGQTATADPQVVRDPAVGDPADSRYRYHDGVWWYQLPSNRWVYWSNGKWVDFVPTTQPSTVLYGSTAPAYSYVPSYRSYSYYPSYSYRYPRYYSSYGYFPSYGGLYGSSLYGSGLYGSGLYGSGLYGGGYYGRGYYGGGLGSAIGLGLSIGHAFSHHHHHGHFHGGHHHGHHHHHSGHLGGHHHHHHH